MRKESQEGGALPFDEVQGEPLLKGLGDGAYEHAPYLLTYAGPCPFRR